MSRKIKKGDEVVVITGEHSGSRGKVLQMIPSKERLLIEGVNMRKRHEKKTQETEGGIVERESSIHLSNVMLAERWDSRKSVS
jgi:large subunit ribosomal protein L24